MKYLLGILSILLIAISACAPNEDSNDADEVIDTQNGEAQSDTKPDRSGKINPNAEFVTRDSVKPIDKKVLEGLKGFKKDSVQMRIKFQEEVNKMNLAFKNLDFQTYVKYIHPGVLKKQGGAKSAIASLQKANQNNPMQWKSIVSGPLIDVADVVDEKDKSSGWYCVLPHKSTVVQNGQEMQANGHLVGYSPDMKRCYFIDITRASDEKVFQLMPDLKFIYDRLPRL